MLWTNINHQNNGIDSHSKLSYYPPHEDLSPTAASYVIWPARFYHKTPKNSLKLKDNFPAPPLLQPAQKMPSSPLNLWWLFLPDAPLVQGLSGCLWSMKIPALATAEGWISPFAVPFPVNIHYGEPSALLATSSSSRMKGLRDGKDRRWGRMAEHLGEVKFSFLMPVACWQQLGSCLMFSSSLVGTAFQGCLWKWC